MQTWAVKGERLPACCSEASEADGGRRDTERQIPRTADALRYLFSSSSSRCYCSDRFRSSSGSELEGAVPALRPARQRPAVNWRTGYRLQATALRGTPAAWADGERARGGERLPSEFRQEEQANTARAAGWQGVVGITSGPSRVRGPWSRAAAQAKQQQRSARAWEAREAAARRLARWRRVRRGHTGDDVSRVAEEALAMMMEADDEESLEWVGCTLEGCSMG